MVILEDSATLMDVLEEVKLLFLKTYLRKCNPYGRT